MTPEEMTSLEELHQYMLEDEGSWALGEGFLNFVGQFLYFILKYLYFVLYSFLLSYNNKLLSLLELI